MGYLFKIAATLICWVLCWTHTDSSCLLNFFQCCPSFFLHLSNACCYAKNPNSGDNNSPCFFCFKMWKVTLRTCHTSSHHGRKISVQFSQCWIGDFKLLSWKSSLAKHLLIFLRIRLITGVAIDACLEDAKTRLEQSQCWRLSPEKVEI